MPDVCSTHDPRATAVAPSWPLDGTPVHQPLAQVGSIAATAGTPDGAGPDSAGER